MELEERDCEIILEKLERMEAFLKPYISSLEEPPEKKGKIRITAEIPFDGEIITWNRGDGDLVEKGWSLCEIEWGDPFVFAGTTTISAPTRGYLDILVGVRREVRPGQLIAIIDEVIRV